MSAKEELKATKLMAPANFGALSLTLSGAIFPERPKMASAGSPTEARSTQHPTSNTFALRSGMMMAPALQAPVPTPLLTLTER